MPSREPRSPAFSFTAVKQDRAAGRVGLDLLTASDPLGSNVAQGLTLSVVVTMETERGVSTRSERRCRVAGQASDRYPDQACFFEAPPSGPRGSVPRGQRRTLRRTWPLLSRANWSHCDSQSVSADRGVPCSRAVREQGLQTDAAVDPAMVSRPRQGSLRPRPGRSAVGQGQRHDPHGDPLEHLVQSTARERE